MMTLAMSNLVFISLALLELGIFTRDPSDANSKHFDQVDRIQRRDHRPRQGLRRLPQPDEVLLDAFQEVRKVRGRDGYRRQLHHGQVAAHLGRPEAGSAQTRSDFVG